MSVDLVDVLALALGLFYFVRWTSLRRARATQTPGSQGPAWQRVERAEARALALMAFASFAKIAVDLAVHGLAPRWGTLARFEPQTSMAIDLCWTALMFLGLGLRASARGQRAKLGMPPQ